MGVREGVRLQQANVTAEITTSGVTTAPFRIRCSDQFSQVYGDLSEAGMRLLHAAIYAVFDGAGLPNPATLPATLVPPPAPLPLGRPLPTDEALDKALARHELGARLAAYNLKWTVAPKDLDGPAATLDAHDYDGLHVQVCLYTDEVYIWSACWKNAGIDAAEAEDLRKPSAGGVNLSFREALLDASEYVLCLYDERIAEAKTRLGDE